MGANLTKAGALFAKCLVILLLLPLCAEATDKHVWEVWTNKDGEQITAELVKQEKDSVELLRKSNMSRFSLTLEDLSKQDQEYLKKRWEAIQKREKASAALLEKFPAPLTKDVYRLDANKFSFNAPKKGVAPDKQMAVTKDGFYNRYARNFRFVTGEAFGSQLDNIGNRIPKDIKRQQDQSGGMTQMALQAKLNVEWLQKSLKPYYEEWRKLQKETELPVKPKPPAPKPAPAKKPEVAKKEAAKPKQKKPVSSEEKKQEPAKPASVDAKKDDTKTSASDGDEKKNADSDEDKSTDKKEGA